MGEMANWSQKMIEPTKMVGKSAGNINQISTIYNLKWQKWFQKAHTDRRATKNQDSTTKPWDFSDKKKVRN